MTIGSQSRSWDPEEGARDGEKSDAGYKNCTKGTCFVMARMLA